MIICFPDHNNITKQENICYQQATITPSEPVLEPEYHWEKPRVNLYGSVFISHNGYEMYYQCGNAVRVGYAVSDDGVYWNRPLINRTDLSAHIHKIVLANEEIEPINLPEINNEADESAKIEMTNLVAGYHMPSVIYEPDSDKPYKIFSFGEEGYRVLYSTNGKQFKEYENNPVIPLLSHKNPETDKSWCSDVAPCFKDENGYTAMVKTYEVDAQTRTRRCVGICRSDDFVHWSEVKTVWVPGENEDRLAKSRGFNWADFYGLCPFRYGAGYLGFLWLFEIEKELPTGTNQGKIEVFLVHSDDCENWHYVSDKPFIPWDLNFGSEGGMVTTPGAPIFDKNDIKVYYSDNNYEHGLFERDFTKEYSAPTWVIRCASIKKERLVGAFSNDGKMILNGPGKLSKIRLNADCSKGDINIQVIAQNGNTFSTAVRGVDDTDQWLVLPSEMVDPAIELSIHDATLYAIEFA